MSVSQFASEAVSETLGRATDVESCVALAKRVNTLMNEAFAHFGQDDPGIACRAGCNFCCHLRVMVLPHEAIALFRYLGSRVESEYAQHVRERVTKNAEEIGKRAREGRGLTTGIPCAFLIDGKCSAYEARPAACSGYHSLSRERCQSAHEAADHAADAIPMLSGLRYIAATLDQGVEQALEEAGLNAERIELHTAVAALIRNPGLIARWRAGRALSASSNTEAG
jgi:Fe-S-cluster containining protein